MSATARRTASSCAAASHGASTRQTSGLRTRGNRRSHRLPRPDEHARELHLAEVHHAVRGADLRKHADHRHVAQRLHGDGLVEGGGIDGREELVRARPHLLHVFAEEIDVLDAERVRILGGHARCPARWAGGPAFPDSRLRSTRARGDSGGRSGRRCPRCARRARPPRRSCWPSDCRRGWHAAGLPSDRSGSRRASCASASAPCGRALRLSCVFSLRG